MLTQIRQFLAAPVFEDEDKTRAAGLLNTILLILAAVTLVIVPSFAIIDPATAMFNLSFGAVIVVIVLGLEFIMRRGYLRIASMLLASSLLAVVTVTVYIFGGIRNNVASAYVLVVAIAALLLGGRAAVAFGLLSMLAALGVFYAEISSAIVFPMPVSVEFVQWLLLSAVLGMGTLLLRYAVRSIAERKRAEEALKRRMEQLAALGQASQAVTASLELDQVLAEIVSLANAVVASDHTTVVLMDEGGQIRQSAENLPGVPAMEYRVREEGLTNWIVRSRQPVVIDEIGEDGAISPDLGEGAPRFFNPPMVEAGIKSCAGLPLMAKGRLLGVLYVHSVRPRAFDGQLPLLTTFANQVAIAIENARLFEQTKVALEALRVSEERFALAVQGANDGIWDWDIANNTLYWSPRMKELLGYADDELDVDFDTFEALLHPDDGERIGAAIEAHLKNREPFDVEQRLRTKSGEYRWFRARGQAVWDKDGQPIRMVGSTTDITELKRAEEELAYMATHDALTGLPNRWLFNDRLTLELARAQRHQQMLAVMLLDLDYFKDVNDTLGHTAGDKLLQTVGERLTSLVRKSDTVARMGGDEFMLLSLFPGIRREEDAVKIAQRILEAFRKPFIFDGREICITTSIGIAIYPKHGEDAETLMKNADTAMYQAKAQGRDNYQHYTPGYER